MNLSHRIISFNIIHYIDITTMRNALYLLSQLDIDNINNVNIDTSLNIVYELKNNSDYIHIVINDTGYFYRTKISNIELNKATTISKENIKQVSNDAKTINQILRIIK